MMVKILGLVMFFVFMSHIQNMRLRAFGDTFTALAFG